MTLWTLLLIASWSSFGILGIPVSGFLAGFGLGPLYPLLLSRVLQYAENPLIFSIAGLGSASLPWLAGIVSSSAGSLRAGLIVPFAGSMLLFLLLMNQNSRVIYPSWHELGG